MLIVEMITGIGLFIFSKQICDGVSTICSAGLEITEVLFIILDLFLIQIPQQKQVESFL